MGDRSKLKKILLWLGAVILCLGIVQARSSEAQMGPTPPPLQQLVTSFDIAEPEATAYAIWNAGQTQRHEVWFRIMGGEADYEQRLRVYKEQAAPRSPTMLPPAATVVYEMASNRTTEWVSLGTESAFFTYYFEGDNRLLGTVDWHNAEAVSVRKSVYNNGDRYEINFEDIDLLDDFDDLRVEVVLVRRQ